MDALVYATRLVWSANVRHLTLPIRPGCHQPTRGLRDIVLDCGAGLRNGHTDAHGEDIWSFGVTLERSA